MRRTAPRPFEIALERQRSDLAPPSLLAAVQDAWPEAVGAALAREATPLSERGGTVTVGCSSATWAHELDLMAPDLIQRLNAVLADRSEWHVRGFRFKSSAGRRGSP